MADKNKLRDKSGQSINDVSFELLPEIKNLRLTNVNKVIIGNINIKDIINPYNCLLKNSDFSIKISNE